MYFTQKKGSSKYLLTHTSNESFLIDQEFSGGHCVLKWVLRGHFLGGGEIFLLAPVISNLKYATVTCNELKVRRHKILHL